MSIKKIKQHNPQIFLDDLKRVRDVVVLPENTNCYLRTTKSEVKKTAETMFISYYISTKVFISLRKSFFEKEK